MISFLRFSLCCTLILSPPEDVSFSVNTKENVVNEA